MKKRTRWIAMLATLLAIPVFAAAPKALSVMIGGVALNGKALWYDNQVYVPLESVSDALGGQYRLDEGRGVASVELARTVPVPDPAARATIQTISERRYSTGDNLKVLATVKNTGSIAARDIEVTCTFQSGYLGEITSSVANLPELRPGQRKTLEFWLYEQRIPAASGGRPYAQPMSVTGSYQPRGNDYVYVAGYWERVTHSLKFDYLNHS